ncbi:MAG TPA: hypothetical protein VN730_15255 [Steroidobacteraceae bacterium]|nr:hypothetical protein [Steroidobacteraceae bacterium]
MLDTSPPRFSRAARLAPRIAIAGAMALALELTPSPAALAQDPAGPLTITFGGYAELAVISRNRTEFADVGSVPFSQLPYQNVENYNISEFRASARQSRFAMLVQGPHVFGLTPEYYMEMDFLGTAPTANSRESNSYNPRMRVFYADFTTDSDFYLLAGQSWSLATLYKKGLHARDEDVPATIDAQYTAGFNWTRNPQLRVVQTFGKALSLGVSLESPQAVTNASNDVPSVLASKAYPSNLLYQAAGNAGGLLNNATNYTIDVAPDVILKAALDPGYGHYELYGLARWFRSAVGTSTYTSAGGGVGAGMYLPIVPNVLTFQMSGLIGKGIGRYSSSQLPDVTVEPTGALSPISAYDVLLGLYFNPVPSFQIYGYLGRDKASSNHYSATITSAGTVSGPFDYGYGSPAYNNSGCYTLGGTCVANIAKSDEATLGFWWKYYTGTLGNLRFGLQLAYNQDTAFGGIGGAPSTSVFEGMASFRYYPYRK